MITWLPLVAICLSACALSNPRPAQQDQRGSSEGVVHEWEVGAALCETDNHCPCDRSCVKPGRDSPGICQPSFPVTCGGDADCAAGQACLETTRFGGTVSCGFNQCVDTACTSDEACATALGCPAGAVCEVCCNAGQCLDAFGDDDGDGQLNCVDAAP